MQDSANSPIFTGPVRPLIALLIVSIVWGGVPVRAGEYSPKSPVVKEMVGRGVAYLGNHGSSAYARLLGGKCVVALALIKAGQRLDHPYVEDALKMCRNVAKVGVNGIEGKSYGKIYSVGIAIIFLCALEDTREETRLKNGETLTGMVKILESLQKKHGGWGYLNYPTGDTSMTQYGVLALWEAKQVGVPISEVSVKRVTNWLLRTQDISGGFGYQAKDPGGFTRIKQNEVRLSMGVAGAGSLYICGDLLGLSSRHKPRKEGLPQALRVKAPPRKARAKDSEVDPGRLQGAKRSADAWCASNYAIDPDGYTHYYLYTLERYYSFQEMAGGRSLRRDWYDEGVRYLKRTQADDGSWQSKGSVVDTAFSILFLQRSTLKSIRRTLRPEGGGVLIGGKGLPKDLTTIDRRGGRIVRPKLRGPAEDQMKILEQGPDHPEFDDVKRYHGDLLTNTNAKTYRQRAERLRNILLGGSADARVVAAEALGKVRDMQFVPTLIRSLARDPDWRVVVKARDGLRLASRKVEGYGLPDKRPETTLKAQEIQLRVSRKWKAWYRSVRPDAFLEE